MLSCDSRRWPALSSAHCKLVGGIEALALLSGLTARDGFRCSCSRENQGLSLVRIGNRAYHMLCTLSGMVTSTWMCSHVRRSALPHPLSSVASPASAAGEAQIRAADGQLTSGSRVCSRLSDRHQLNLQGRPPLSPLAFRPFNGSRCAGPSQGNRTSSKRHLSVTSRCAGVRLEAPSDSPTVLQGDTNDGSRCLAQKQRRKPVPV